MKYVVLITFLFFLFTLLSCAPAPAPEATFPVETKKALEVLTPVLPWQQEWDKLVIEAKKEGKLIIFSSLGGEARTPLTTAFKSKFGIDIEMIIGKGAEISQKLLSERNAGIYNADLYLGGNTTLLNQLKPRGVFDPLESQLFLPEVLELKNWWQGKLLWVDKDKTSLAFTTTFMGRILYNTNLVREGEIKSLKDLLAPKYKGGKISFNDPTVAGVGLRWFWSTIVMMGNDDSIMRNLAKQDPLIIRDQKLQVDWVSQGKTLAALAAEKPEVVVPYMEAGAPIQYVTPVEGLAAASGSSNIAIIKQAPHLKAARLFINWLLSREGQILWQDKIYFAQSAREDLPVDATKYLVRDPRMNIFFTDVEEWLLKEPEWTAIAKEIFGPLMK